MIYEKKIIILLRISIFIFIIINLIISLNEYVWLDEVASINLINVTNYIQLIRNLVHGADTNPPLYFSLLYFSKYLYDDIILFKLLSFTFFLLAIRKLFYFLKKNIGTELCSLLPILVLVISPFFISGVMSEIRGYSLWLLLTVYFFEIYASDSVWKKKDVVKIAVLGALMLYTHYFSLFYLIMFIIIEIFYHLKTRKGNLQKLLGLILALILYLPWIGAIINQFKSVNGATWQNIPSLLEMLFFVRASFGVSFFVIIVICALELLLEQRKFPKKFFDRKNLSIIVLSPLLVHLILVILANKEVVVYMHRYFVPTMVSYLVFLSILLYNIKNKKMVALISILLIVIGVYRTDYHAKDVDIKNEIVNTRIKLLENGNVLVCESPHIFYPLYMYSRKTKYVQNLYYVLDSTSSFDSRNIKNSQFDYLGNKNLLKFYDNQQILEWKNFKEKNLDNFYVVNERDRMLFEVLWENDTNYVINIFNSEIMEVKKRK